MKEEIRPTIWNYLIPVLLILIGLRAYAKHGPGWGFAVPIVLGSSTLYMVLFNRRLLKTLERVVMKIWEPAGVLITTVLLSAAYLLVFVPIGLCLRLMKKDILNKNFKTNHLSYWVERRQKNTNYRQQF